jgi:hypothetical protein
MTPSTPIYRETDGSTPSQPKAPTTDQLRGLIGPQLDCPIPGIHFEDGKPRIHVWTTDALAVLGYLQERDELRAALSELLAANDLMKSKDGCSYERLKKARKAARAALTRGAP